MIVYHGTPHRFDAFEIERGGRYDGATNGALGVWVTDREDIAKGFCKGSGHGYIMTLEVPADRPYDMSVEKLHALHNAADHQDREKALRTYSDLSTLLRMQGHDIIRIIESEGSHPTMVCLNHQAIVITKVDPC